MRSNFQKSLFPIFFISLLHGCGSDNNSSPTSTDDPTNIPTLPEPTTVTDALGNQYTGQTKALTGKAIDGYLQGALVCVDVNANGLCDSTDPFDLTDSDGNYSIDAPIDVADLQPDLLVFALPGSTIDSDSENNQPVEQGYSMSAPWDSQNITPLTSMVVETMNSGLSQSEAEETVKRQLNLKLDSIDDDYIALKDDSEKSVQAEDAHEKAQMLVEVFATIRAEFEGSTATQDEVTKDKGDKAYHYYIRDNNVMEEILTSVEAELAPEQDDSSQPEDQQITIDEVQENLIDKVKREVKANNHLVDIAASYQQPASNERKTEVLREYLAKGYYYYLTDHDGYGHYDELSLSDDNIFTLTEWVYNQTNSGSEWTKITDENDDNADDLIYRNGVFEGRSGASGNASKAEFDDKGNVQLEQWNEFLMVNRILDLSNQYMALTLSGGKDSMVPASILGRKFPAGAEAIRVRGIQVADEYKAFNGSHGRVDYWVDGGTEEVTSLDDLLKVFKFAGGVQERENCEEYCKHIVGNPLYTGFGSLQFDLGEDATDALPITGSVYLFKSGHKGHQPEQVSQKGSWYREKLPMDNGEESEIEIVRVELPADYRRDYERFYVALPDEQHPGQTIVRQGEMEKAGTINEEFALYNKQAMDAIKSWVKEHYYSENTNNSSNDQDDSSGENAFLDDITEEVDSIAEKENLIEQYFSQSYYLYNEKDTEIVGTIDGGDGKFTTKEEIYRDGEWQSYDRSEEEGYYGYNQTKGSFQLGYDPCDQSEYAFDAAGGIVKYGDNKSTIEIHSKLDLSGQPLAWATAYDNPADDYSVPMELVGKFMPEGSEGLVIIDNCPEPHYTIGKTNWNRPIEIESDFWVSRGRDGGFITITPDVTGFITGSDDSDETEMTVPIYQYDHTHGELAKESSKTVTLKVGSLPLKESQPEGERKRIILLELPEDLKRGDKEMFFMATEDQKSIQQGYVQTHAIKDETVVLYNQVSIGYIKKMIELLAD